MFAQSQTNSIFLAIAIILVLIIVAVVSIQQVLIVNKLKPVGTKNKLLAAGHKAVIAGAVLFALHTVFLDGLGWNIGFFS